MYRTNSVSLSHIHNRESGIVWQFKRQTPFCQFVWKCPSIKIYYKLPFSNDWQTFFYQFKTLLPIYDTNTLVPIYATRYLLLWIWQTPLSQFIWYYRSTNTCDELTNYLLEHLFSNYINTILQPCTTSYDKNFYS